MGRLSFLRRGRGRLTLLHLADDPLASVIEEYANNEHDRRVIAMKMLTGDERNVVLVALRMLISKTPMAVAGELLEAINEAEPEEEGMGTSRSWFG